jgi:hypothetical protein
MKSIMTDTAVRFQKIYQHQPCLVTTAIPGRNWRGIILSPSPLKSFVRFNENGTLRETRIDNKRLVPVRLNKQ